MTHDLDEAQIRLLLLQLQPRRAGIAAMLAELDRQIAELQADLEETEE
jgi:hypothetical protein